MPEESRVYIDLRQTFLIIDSRHLISFSFTHPSLQDIEYDGFRRFLDAFLDCETPEELSKHLFISFLKPALYQAQHSHGKALCQMAAISSNAACAPVTSHNRGDSQKWIQSENPSFRKTLSIKRTFCWINVCFLLFRLNPGSIPNLNNIIDLPTPQPSQESQRNSFVERIHGITDKLQSLGGHLGHDSGGGGDRQGKSGRFEISSYFIASSVKM